MNGDSEILSDFQFEPPETPLEEAVYTWRSLNPVNQLVYGFGGVKLFPKSAFLSASSFIDMSTSLGAPYRIVCRLASVTRFNSSPFEAWRGGFRECAKLSSQCIPNQRIIETEQRLGVWLSKGKERPFGPCALLGARQGSAYGRKHKHDRMALAKLNDFSWLERFFLKHALDCVD